MEGLQNMTVGALEAFLPIYAVTVAVSMNFRQVFFGRPGCNYYTIKPVMGRTSDRYGRKPLITQVCSSAPFLLEQSHY